MADFFWVGGSGNWNDSANHWSATSGGAPGAGVPGSGDDCIFDANSFTAGSKTVTFNVAPNVKSMNFTGATNNPIVDPNNGATINGDLTLISGMTWGSDGTTLTFGTTGTTCNFTSAGVTIGQANVLIIGSGTFNLQDDTTINRSGIDGTFRSSGTGTINLNGNDLTCFAFQVIGGSATFDISSSIITLTATGGGSDVWSMGAGNTITTTGSTINISGSTVDFIGGGKTYQDISITGSSVTVSGVNTFDDFTVSAGKTILFANNQTMNTLTALGTSGSHITLKSSANGTQRSLCVTTWNVTYVDFQDIIASCSFLECCECGNNGNNSGIDFCTSRAFLLTQI